MSMANLEAGLRGLSIAEYWDLEAGLRGLSVADLEAGLRGCQWQI